MPSEYTGSALYMEWINSSGTTVLNTDYRRLEINEPIDTVDSSAGADTHRSVLTTLTVGTIRIELLDQTGGTALFNSLAMGTDGTLNVGPEGTATGKPKQSIHAVVTTRDRAFIYDQVTALTIEMRMQAASTNSNY